MKRFFIILFTILGFSVFTEAQELTQLAIERRLEKSDKRLENERHSLNPKTWVDRGIIFQDMYDVNIQFLYFGMAQEELKLFMREPKEIRTEETETGLRDVMVYDNIEVFFEEGQLTGWNETNRMHDNRLAEASAAFNKAIQLEKETEPGFFQRLFGGSQENRLRNSYLRLNGQYISQAVLQYEDSRYSESFESFRASIEITDSPYFDEPLDAGLVFNAGFVATLAGRPEDALKFFNRAKDMGYGEGNLYVLIKDAYVELGDSLGAEQILQEGFEKFPQDNTILVELVNYYIIADNAQAAFNYLQLAIEQEPNNPSFHYAKGTLYERMDEKEKAKLAYQTSIDLDPDFFEVNYNMGVLYYNEAVKLFEIANEIMDNAEYEIARNEAFAVLAKSVPYLEQAHKVNPEDPYTMETLRILYYRLEMEDKLDEINKKLGREVTPQ